jgi:hypothetical protein
MRTDKRLADGPSQVKRHRQQIMFSLKVITNDFAFSGEGVKVVCFGFLATSPKKLSLCQALLSAQ